MAWCTGHRPVDRVCHLAVLRTTSAFLLGCPSATAKIQRGLIWSLAWPQDAEAGAAEAEEAATAKEAEAESMRAEQAKHL